MRYLLRRTRLLACVITLVVPLLGLTPDPAAAATTTSGTAAFRGTANLPTFPCQPPAPFGNGPCTGTFNGDWSGHLSGVSNTSVFEVTWSTSTGSAISVPSFTYAEWDCNLHAEAALGIARGSGTASAGPGQVGGNWQVPGEPFARAITRVYLSFSFQWTRFTNTALVTLSPASLTLDVAGLGTVPVLNSPQTATATFVPVTTSTIGVPSCATPNSIQGLIAGDIALAGTL